jgi:glycerol-3-phosphate dehydrogenase
LQDYINEINLAYSGIDLSIDDITTVNTGHILFGSEAAQGSAIEHSFAKRSLLIDHVRDGVEGIVTIIGARATVARGDAEKIMNLVQRKLGDRIRRSNTQDERLYGGEFDNFGALVRTIRAHLPDDSQHAAESIAHNYGSQYSAVLECASTETLRKTVDTSTVIGAEAIHAVRHEMAKTLADIVLRRTELGSGDNPGDDAIRYVAELVSSELGWDDEERVSQIETVQKILRNGGPWNFVDQLPREELGIS